MLFIALSPLLNSLRPLFDGQHLFNPTGKQKQAAQLAFLERIKRRIERMPD
jgi:hypothetical protein